MSRILVVATGGAGGDLQPLLAVAQALHERGHSMQFTGDRSVERAVADFADGVELLPGELDLGPRLATSIREAMVATNGDLAAAGPLVQASMGSWAREVSEPVAALIARGRPSAVVTSLFGVEVLADAAPQSPWAVVNSTFYIGPDPPRPLAFDMGPRAVPLIVRYATLPRFGRPRPPRDRPHLRLRFRRASAPASLCGTTRHLGGSLRAASISR